jgi:phosphoribosylamine--glycine ligase
VGFAFRETIHISEESRLRRLREKPDSFEAFQNDTQCHEEPMKKIAFAGTDGRTLLCAFVVSTATSETSDARYEGVVVRGTPAMPKFVETLDWPVSFVPTRSNTPADYADAIAGAMAADRIDYLVPMPEALLFEGLVDELTEKGFGDRILGLSREGAFIEGDKIRCKKLCRDAGVPVADAWDQVDAKNYAAVQETCLDYIDRFGGAVIKYPYSAGGKGARIILNAWELREVYDTLFRDYKKSYRQQFGKNTPWPLLIESRMSGVEISFTILVDAGGNFQILPTAMDYPERFEGPASKDNPITGGVGAISPHPMESAGLLEMAGETIARPVIRAMGDRGILRPCILYPGCFVSMDGGGRPTRIRVSEINIRPGEPEAQPVARRLRNLGRLIEATMEGELDRVAPEVRDEQVSLCIALVTGPGGPDGQKGYPWSCTKGEPVDLDFKYMKRKGIQVIPSAMAWDEDDRTLKSDGTRVAFLNANATVKEGERRGEVADRLRKKLLAAFDNGKMRVIPREGPEGNRLDLRRDIGRHYLTAEEIFQR